MALLDASPPAPDPRDATALIAATTIGASAELLTCDTDLQHIATCTPLRVRLLPAQ